MDRLVKRPSYKRRGNEGGGGCGGKGGVVMER